MPDYQKMYGILFNEVTDVIKRLQKAQQDAEQVFVNEEDPAPPEAGDQTQ